jgi:hypothetical protein
VINQLNKVPAVAHLSAGVMTRKEMLVFPSITVDARLTKTIIRLRAHVTIIARNLALAKVSTHCILGFMLHVWFSEKKEF